MRRFSSIFSRSSLGNLRERIIDESITVVMLSVAAVVAGMMLTAMLLSSCSGNGDGKKKAAHAAAEECIRLLADNPESVRVIALSEPDSVFGRNFFSDDELVSILDNISALNDRLFSGSLADIDLDDPRVCSQMRRGASVSDIIQNQMLSPGETGKFTGWKVKALYECADQFGDTVKNERYLIFDRDMTHIIHSFEIPIL